MRIMKQTIDNRRLLGLLAVVILCLALIPLTTTSTLVQGAATESEFELTLDEYPDRDGSVIICGANWSMFAPTDPTGSGVFHSFFRMGADGNERGYNTDYRGPGGDKMQFDELSSKTFTHSVLLADVPKVMSNQTIWREFQLDINEQKKDPTWYVSMDEFQVWVTPDPELTGYHVNSDDGSGDGYFDPPAELVYNLDGCGEDWWIKMDYRINPGSGKRDYKVLVPDSYFPEEDEGLYCVIYARHGLQGSVPGFEDWASDDGYEEWGVAVYPAHKSGYKFHDLNANHVWDKGDEPGLNGWEIILDGTDATGHSVHMETMTTYDSKGDPGYYEFIVDPGTYTVSEVLKDGWKQSYPEDNGGEYVVTLGNGDLDPDNNFGNYQEANLSVTKTGTITYTIKVHNSGPAPACNVLVTDDLPGDLVWAISGSPPPSVFDTTDLTDNVFTGTIDSMVSGADAEATFEAPISGGPIIGAMISNNVTVYSDTPDPDLNDNIDYADIGPVIVP